jgi:xanthosine utilization system XapX-like protein
MAENGSVLLSAWTTFYITTGSSSAALTGLMFVVITLVRRATSAQDGVAGLAAFSTPTVLHFGSALLVSLILTAPWHSLVPPAIILGLVGLYGVLYGMRVAYLTRRLTAYTADREDWIWYMVLPVLSYAALLAGAAFLVSSPERALFAIAGGVVLLVFIGLRNAWDVVTYLAVVRADDPE